MLLELLTLGGGLGTLDELGGHHFFKLFVDRLRALDKLFTPLIGELNDLNLIADFFHDLFFVFDGQLARIVTGHIKSILTISSRSGVKGSQGSLFITAVAVG